MRNRTGSKWNRYSMWLALSVGALGLVMGLTAGCGGGGSDTDATPSPTPTPTPAPASTTFRPTILRPARTRIEATCPAPRLPGRVGIGAPLRRARQPPGQRNRDPLHLPPLR